MKKESKQDQEAKKWIRCRMCGEFRKKSDKNHICHIEYHLYKKFETDTKENSKKALKEWLRFPDDQSTQFARQYSFNIHLPHYEIWMETFKDVPMVMKEMNKINKEYQQYERYE